MLDKSGFRYHIPADRAEVAELVDALGSGSSGGILVGVRLSPSAPSILSPSLRYHLTFCPFPISTHPSNTFPLKRNSYTLFTAKFQGVLAGFLYSTCAPDSFKREEIITATEVMAAASKKDPEKFPVFSASNPAR